jgi:hypothetical protein
MPVAPEKKRPRKVVPKREEQPKMKKNKIMREVESEGCYCDSGHESLVDCEKAMKEKRMDMTMRSVSRSYCTLTT